MYFCIFFSVDCNENCKLRKQLLENECKQLRKELSISETQSRNYEQEVSPAFEILFLNYSQFPMDIL